MAKTATLLGTSTDLGDVVQQIEAMPAIDRLDAPNLFPQESSLLNYLNKDENANRFVGYDELAEVWWGNKIETGKAERHILHTYISRIRQGLGDDAVRLITYYDRGFELVTNPNARKRKTREIIPGGGLKLDLERHTLLYENGKEKKLGYQEYKIIQHLTKNANHIITVDELTQALWSSEKLPKNKYHCLYSNYFRLKKQLGKYASHLINHHGGGYEWVTDPNNIQNTLPDKLLKHLMEKADHVATIDELTQALWSPERVPQDKYALSGCVIEARKKLGPLAVHLIHHFGVGYEWVTNPNGNNKQKHNTISAGDLELDVETHILYKNGKDKKLSPTKFKLLKYLMENANIACSHENIITNVWGYDSDATYDTIWATINNLRREIGDGYIENILNFGYKFNAPNSNSSTPKRIAQSEGVFFDMGGHELHRGREKIQLYPRAYTVLEKLVDNHGLTVTQSQLIDSLNPYGENIDVSEHNIYTIIWRLRTQLGDNSRNPKLIRTMRGIGYSLIAKVSFSTMQYAKLG